MFGTMKATVQFIFSKWYLMCVCIKYSSGLFHSNSTSSPLAFVIPVAIYEGKLILVELCVEWNTMPSGKCECIRRVEIHRYQTKILFTLAPIGWQSGNTTTSAAMEHDQDVYWVGTFFFILVFNAECMNELKSNVKSGQNVMPVSVCCIW